MTLQEAIEKVMSANKKAITINTANGEVKLSRGFLTGDFCKDKVWVQQGEHYCELPLDGWEVE